MFVNEMPKKRRKKEILIDTSSVSPRKREEELLKDTTGIESYHVSKISTRVGRLLSGLMAVVGVLLFIFSLYILFVDAQFSFQGFEVLFSVILGFLGVVNILCGLILLAKE
jgi:hypothetical protein